jgi:hypothetical protein
MLPEAGERVSEQKLAEGIARSPDSYGRETRVSSDIATNIPRDDPQLGVQQRPLRALAVQVLGPMTVVCGIVWAVAQPYRITLFDREGQGFYDYLLQAPLLVILVGLVFALAIAPTLVDDLAGEVSRDPEA